MFKVTHRYDFVSQKVTPKPKPNADYYLFTYYSLLLLLLLNVY